MHERRASEPRLVAGLNRVAGEGDLVRQWVHVRGVDRHHRIEEEREIDPLRLARELKRGGVPVEGPRALRRCRGDCGLVGRAEQPLFEPSVRELVENLDRPRRSR